MKKYKKLNKSELEIVRKSCEDCAKELCRRNISHDGTTWHYGICDNCRRHILITEPRDFGGLK